MGNSWEFVGMKLMENKIENKLLLHDNNKLC